MILCGVGWIPVLVISIVKFVQVQRAHKKYAILYFFMGIFGLLWLLIVIGTFLLVGALMQ